MGSSSALAVVRASETTGQISDHSADQTVSEIDDEWFAAICEKILPKDAGLALRIATGFEERTCYRYAAGDRKPPGYFIRALLRDNGGWTWLAALMEGSDAPWWLDLVAARDLLQRYQIRQR